MMKLKNMNRSEVVLFALAVLLIAGSLTSWLSFKGQNAESTNAAVVCVDESDGSLLAEAAASLQPSDNEKMKALGTVVDKIQKLKGYEDHYNCVYPVTFHYIHMGDVANAESHLEFLKKAKSQALSNVFTYRITTAEVEAHIQALKSFEEETADNAILF